MAVSHQRLAAPAPVNIAPNVNSKRTPLFHVLLVIATLLFAAQLVVGTSIFFSLCVYISLIVVIFTLRIIGYTSVPGILMGVVAVHYIGFSQIIKTLYGQPGDSNLMAPDTTIGVLLLGIASMCAAAILAAAILRNRKVIKLEATPATLIGVRNISLVIGICFLAVSRMASQTGDGDVQYGGIGGIAGQFYSIVYFPILAETWRNLMLSQGRRSMSPFLFVLVGALTVVGIFSGSKEGIANPTFIYILGSLSYRRFVTKSQIMVVVCASIFGVIFFYPFAHVMRGRLNPDHSAAVVVGEMIDEMIEDPGYLYKEFERAESQPMLERDLMTQGLYYLGSFDALANRFMLISNTDVIVNAVNQDGPFGLQQITDGFELLLPTFLAPDKPRISMGDQVTWYYGLRAAGQASNPTIGILASCYSTLEWMGMIVIPFTIFSVFFYEVLLFGRSMFGNIAGVYLIFCTAHGISEQSVDGVMLLTLRTVPLYILIVMVIFYISKIISLRKRRRSESGHASV